ncbi:hypothetical protein QTP88_000842 [Uroleucon formosanum]
MGTKSWIQLHSVYEFFKEEVKLVKRGENANDSGHVRECIFVNNNLKGIVKASMRDQTYNIEVYFSDNGDITHAKWNCARGQVSCHHNMSTLLIFAYKNVSVTSANELYPVSQDKVDYCTTVAIRSSFKDDVFSKLTNLGIVVGLSWLLSPEPGFIPVVELEDIRSSEFEQSNDKQQYLFEKVSMIDDDILKLASETIGQDLNSKWLVKRRYRIIASNFGPVLSTINRKENEKQGILEFEQIKNLHLQDYGFIRQDLVFVEIHKDPGWTENINKLVSFYFQKFIPFLTNKDTSM